MSKGPNDISVNLHGVNKPIRLIALTNDPNPDYAEVTADPADSNPQFGNVVVPSGPQAVQVRPANTGRIALQMYVNTNVTVYVGPNPNVSIANGIPISQNTSNAPFQDRDGRAAWYAIVASGNTGDLRWIEYTA